MTCDTPRSRKASSVPGSGVLRDENVIDLILSAACTVGCRLADDSASTARVQDVCGTSIVTNAFSNNRRRETLTVLSQGVFVFARWTRLRQRILCNKRVERSAGCQHDVSTMTLVAE